MSDRCEFEMSVAQYEKLLDACRPTPLIYLSGGQSMFTSQQERANHAWSDLGDEMGFKPMTVRPGDYERRFTAEPVE